MLSDRVTSITEVAFNLGYSSSSSFSLTFRNDAFSSMRDPGYRAGQSAGREELR
jgi:AraC-like DNA-binding protein